MKSLNNVVRLVVVTEIYDQVVDDFFDGDTYKCFVSLRGSGDNTNFSNVTFCLHEFIINS